MDAEGIRDRLVQQAPFAMLVRGTIDWFFDPGLLDALADEAARTNYTRDIHFADLVELLLPVVFGSGASVRSAYRGNARLAAVATLTSFYAKLNHVDPEVSRALVRRTAERAAAVLADGPDSTPPRTGYRLLTLDGNHLPATERRLDGLKASGPLPGWGLALRDSASGLFLDLLPVPDAYEREVVHAPPLLRTALRPDDCVVADREFCSASVFDAVREAGAFFVIRHRRPNRLHELTPLGEGVRSADRTVREQTVRYAATDREYRAVRVELATPTQDGEKVVTLLTNLPATVDAVTVADWYRDRRSIETAFHELAMALHGEVRTLAYPKAALLGFALAVAVYNLLRTVRQAVAAEHGAPAADDLSAHALCQEVGTHLPTLLLIFDRGGVGPHPDWDAGAMRNWLRGMARRIAPSKYKKSRGKPGSSRAKPPRPPHKHESTQRLLNTRAKEKRTTP